MTELLSGMLTAGYLVAALHFLKFRTKTGDRLFLAFSIAFALLALQRAALVLLADVPEATLYLYGVRVIAFLLIVAAIIDKNRARAG
jgi:hypothetical protein